MNEYLIVGVVTCLAAATLFVLVRMYLGNGLMTRVFSVAMPSLALMGYIGFVLGKQGISLWVLGVGVVVAGAAILLMVYVIQRSIVARIRMQTDTVLSVVSQLSATSQESAASAEEQASAVAQVTSSIDEIHRMSQTTSDNSQKVVKVADQAVSKGHEGLDSVRDVVTVMDRFSQATDFVQVVGEVAEQSNLLAVNAGIEASKAGEYGRGFAVVANEVRNLAEQSREAAKQIREAIEQTRVGRTGLSKTDDVISDLGRVLQEASDRARQISGAAVQQAAGIKQISDAMSNLTQGGRDAALASKQIQEAVTRLNSVSNELVNLVSGKSTARSSAGFRT